MALIKMKRFHMLAMKEDKQRLLKLLQSLGCVEISQADIADSPKVEPPSNADLERLKWAIAYLGKYSNVKKPLFASDVYISKDEAEAICQRKAELMDVVAAAEQVEREQGKLMSEQLKLEAALEELYPWAELSVSLEDFHDTQETRRFLGYLPNTSWAALKEDPAFSEQLLYFELISERAGASYLALVVHKDSFQQVLKLLKDNEFVQVALRLEQTVAQQIQDRNAEKQEISTQSDALKAQLTELSQQLPQLERLYDLLSIEQQRAEQSAKLYQTQSSFYVKGWVPEHAVRTVEFQLQKCTPHVEIEIADPLPEEEPPVLMQNGSVVTPFESVVKGFSYPSPEGLDPTALMMPFFANFFGMMLSDAGYGLVMAIVLPILLKKFNPKVSTKNMFKLLLWGAGFTILWGALYNTWFGFAPFPSLFDPVSKPMPVMLMCIAIGAVHLFTGLFAAAYMNIRRKDIKSAVFDQLSWALLLIGLGLLLVPQTASVGRILALAGALIILLTAGRAKKNLFGRLLGGFGALYGITGWISDLLSYMRLFGMGLATGVIGQVINILIGMVFQSGIIGMVIGSVLFVAAHTFNLGINALGAYVHSCRLQYIEFFGKFYEDGGRPFDPLSEKTRYIHISKEN